MILKLSNSLTRRKEDFTPHDPQHVRMYVCGPTVYDRPHIGNARAVVVYDALFRLLRHIYGEKSVLYARNITDVDDKIITAARERGISIQQVTAEVTLQFHEDMEALNCLRPTYEPKATQYIGKMISMIERLLDLGHAYISDNHVLFDVTSYAEYGALSGRKLEELIAGARVEVESYKQHPGDFVLWKPADAEDDESSVFPSPWGEGRPGWHIECSAMSTDLLEESFDLHGGGADLKFPHHENEIAQSCCANPGSEFARFWMHNGFLTVNGEKMSKSLGNFITVKDLLDKGIPGEVIRFTLLSSHYSKPLDWTEKLLEDSRKTLDGWYRKVQSLPPSKTKHAIADAFLEILADDLNFPRAIAYIHQAAPEDALAAANLLGLLHNRPAEWLKSTSQTELTPEIQALIDARNIAKKAKSWAEADKIRDELKAKGIILEDKPDGTTEWRRG